MTKGIDLPALLSHTSHPHQRVASFALVCLGVIESLTSGTVPAREAVELFFNAENCLFVHNGLGNGLADEIMGRGVQLQDLFDALPEDEARQEYRSELTEMHDLCLKLVEENKVAA